MTWTQAQVNDAALRMLDGDEDARRAISTAIGNGEITVQAGGTGLRFRAVLAPNSPFLVALKDLYATADHPRNKEIAEEVGVSEATISRLLAGQRAGNWPIVRLVIEYLGGSASDFRSLWEEARGK